MKNEDLLSAALKKIESRILQYIQIFSIKYTNSSVRDHIYKIAKICTKSFLKVSIFTFKYSKAPQSIAWMSLMKFERKENQHSKWQLRG